ncbi:hypothetical protein F4782DRAFT_325967 [Xylaria castorea]|nr:hypothetical protein F4782DRAFT_325967 [Xylaria castorea]
MSSPHPNEGRMPDSTREPSGSDSASSRDHLPSLNHVPSVTHSDTPSSRSFGDFSTGLSVDDDDDGDVDSAVFDIDQAQSSTSVTSSIYNFVQEHGRTYHRYKEGKYWMPNDEVSNPLENDIGQPDTH